MKDEKTVNDGASKKDRPTIARSGILVANCYDYPQYYDIAFQAYTQREADFIEVACRKYCSFDVRRLLEPACGSGRLVTELAARGYQMTGFDLSQSALSYLRRRLKRRRQEGGGLTGVLLGPRSAPDFSRFSSSREIGCPKGRDLKNLRRTGGEHEENFRKHNRNRSQRF